MTKKMTKKEMFAQIMANYNLTDAERDFIQHEIDLLARKNATGEKKPTAQQKVNEAIKEAILDCMELNRLYTITEIQKEVPQCNDLSNQRVSALVRQLKDAELIERVEEKRKAYFMRRA